MKNSFAKKSFGQNFLIDQNYIDKIISALDPQKGETIIEIGAGRGALTEKLVESGANIIAIELERAMIAVLRGKFADYKNFQLVEQDALQTDFKQRTKDKGQRTKDKSKIILVGFMGSGKTTVAKALAEKLDCEFVDLDRFIESIAGQSPASIIDKKGEARFREIESKVLSEVLENISAKIVALGGGAWTIEENRKLIFEHDCLSVWLDVPFETCWKRIKTESDTRPLARDKESARKLYDARREVYSLSKIRVDLSKEINDEAIANEIIKSVTGNR